MNHIAAPLMRPSPASTREKNQLVVLRGLSLQQKARSWRHCVSSNAFRFWKYSVFFRIAKRRAVVSQQIIPGFTAQQVTVDLNKRVAATRAAQVDCARQIFLPVRRRRTETPVRVLPPPAGCFDDIGR